MRTVLEWTDKMPDRDGMKSRCYDIAFRPDGLQLVAAVGSRVLVYDAVDGDLLHSLKGHKDLVYCVAYSRDGKRFASGGKDNAVIIWTSRAEGVLRYSHNDSIQCLAYNPASGQLASATATDFGLWSPEQKSVAKHKLVSKALCMAWTSDGQTLAIGTFGGLITLRDRTGAEKGTIQRDGPIWSVAFDPSREEPRDVLAVGCWDGTLSFYSTTGEQVGEVKQLGYDPCSVSYFAQGEFLLTAGTNKKVTLTTSTGIALQPICERDSWVWAARHRPKANFIAVGCEDGSVTMYQLTFTTVHGLYQEQYASRENMTDVVVQNLISDQKVRLRMNDYVKKIAVYRDRLAVQLADSVRLFTSVTDSGTGQLEYRPLGTISRNLDCNLLVVTKHHIILCHEKQLQLYGFSGEQEREWVLDSVIRYIKVVGGPPGREGLLVGVKSGGIFKIFVDNPFPVPLVKHPNNIRCLDLSASRTRLAVVDDKTSVVVYDLKTGKPTFEATGGNSVAWNSDMDDMLCWSGNGTLCIRTGDFPPSEQKMQGFVVGFRGSKIFCLHFISMQSIDVPQSASVYRYLEKRQIEKAYEVACLGVTDADWRHLAMTALENLETEPARKAFGRLRDVRFMELISRIEASRKKGEGDPVLKGEALAYAGKFKEAAAVFGAAGRPDLALEMYTDLRRFEEAKAWAEKASLIGVGALSLKSGIKSPAGKGAGGFKGAGGGISVSAEKELESKAAEWNEESNHLNVAVDMYIKAGKFDKAITIIAKQQWADKLTTILKQLGPDDRKALAACGALFRKWGDVEHAREAFMRLGDTKSLVGIAVEAGRWDEARRLAHGRPELAEDVYLPHARALLAGDRFDEALVAFRQAGKGEEAARLLEGLTRTAVSENRIRDAGYYYWQLAREAAETPGADQAPERFKEYYQRAEMYFAYSAIRQAQEEPFRFGVDERVLMETARLLLCMVFERGTNAEMPFGISMAYILKTLADEGRRLGAMKLSRWAYERMQTLRLPVAWRDIVEKDLMNARALPMIDSEDLQPTCYRCGQPSPLTPVEGKGDTCSTCGGRFYRSFLTFQHLPLIEFRPAPGITSEEALALLDESPPPDAVRPPQQRRGPGGADVLSIGGYGAGGGGRANYGAGVPDPFDKIANGRPAVLDRVQLKALPRSEVLVRAWPGGVLPTEFFHLRHTDVPVVVDGSGHFYEQDEFESFVLTKMEDPFCRISASASLDGSLSSLHGSLPTRESSARGRSAMLSLSDGGGGRGDESSPNTPPAGAGADAFRSKLRGF